MARSLKRRGAHTVELAFVLPVFVSMVLGIVELGHAFMVQHLIQDAARQGCRTAILPQATNAIVTDLITKLLKDEGIPQVTISILVNNAPGEVASATTNDDVRVCDSIAASDVSLIPNCRLLNYLTDQLQGSSSLRRP